MILSRVILVLGWVFHTINDERLAHALQGNILIHSTYERNVPTIRTSVAQLGFKFSDLKILLGTHAYGDHQEGDGLVKVLLIS